MSATLARDLPDGDAWAFEVKLDGVRGIAYIDGDEFALESRNTSEITARYPELAGLPESVGGRRMILDGEVVAPDDKGRPSFQRLQRRMHVTDPHAVTRLVTEVPIAFLVFDVLWLDDDSTMELPYATRRRMLEDLDIRGPAWQTPASHVGGGDALLAGVRAQGLEGLMAKRLDSPYLPGRRTRTWLKIKAKRRQELVVGGWCPGEGRRANSIGALMVGYWADPDRLVYAGNVGTGFTDAELDRLSAVLQPLRRETCPFTAVPPGRRGAVWVEPEVVVEVEFTEWTDEGTLRHPSYKGQRNDKNPHDVVREVEG
jgi:bifunctional non-homologous end joining protein LigD